MADFEGALRGLADVIVRELADICLIDLVQETGELKRLAIATSDARDPLIAEVLDRFSARPGTTLPAEVARTGQARLFRSTSSEELEAMALSKDAREALQRLAPFFSAVVVPLDARGRTLGVLALYRRRAKEIFDESDLRFVREVGHMAGLHIDNARLYKVAQESIEQRDQVLGIVAHDLRSPLNSIVLRLQLVARTLVPKSPAGDAIRVALQRIQEAALQMDRLIGDLLDLTRSRRGPLQVDLHPCSPPCWSLSPLIRRTHRPSLRACLCAP
jgi:signal transduction histidine kinase